MKKRALIIMLVFLASALTGFAQNNASAPELTAELKARIDAQGKFLLEELQQDIQQEHVLITTGPSGQINENAVRSLIMSAKYDKPFFAHRGASIADYGDTVVIDVADKTKQPKHYQIVATRKGFSLDAPVSMSEGLPENWRLVSFHYEGSTKNEPVKLGIGI